MGKIFIVGQTSPDCSAADRKPYTIRLIIETNEESKIMLVIWIAALLFSFNDTPPITPENVTQIEVVNRLAINGIYAEELAFNPTNSHELALAQNDGLVSIWDVITAERIAEWRGSETTVNAITYTSDGKYIITAADDGNLILWDSITYEIVKTLNLPEQTPIVLDTAPNNIIAVGYKDGNVRLWDTNTGTNILTLYGYNAPVVSVDISLNGSYLAFGHGFGPLFIYKLKDIAQQQIYFELLIDDGELRDFAFLPNPPLPPFFGDAVIVTANIESAGGPIEVWDAPLHSFHPPNWKPQSTMAYPSSLSFNHDGSLLAVFGKATTAGGSCDTNPCPIEIIGMPYDPNGSENAGQVLVTLVEHQAWPVDVVFSTDSRYLASADNLGLVLIWGIPQS